MCVDANTSSQKYYHAHLCPPFKGLVPLATGLPCNILWKYKNKVVVSVATQPDAACVFEEFAVNDTQ